MSEGAGPDGPKKRAKKDAKETAPEVSVIIPCFNERDAIGETLERIKSVMAQSDLVAEIIVVNDGSTDGTEDNFKEPIDGVHVLHNDTNRGYGYSLKRGVHRARAPLIAIIDADATYPPEKIPELVRTVQSGDCDMAVAARTGDAVSIPLLRRPPKYVLGRMASFVAGRNIPDMNSGLRVFPKSVAERLTNILPDGFSFTTTITLAMITNGYEVKYFPIDYFQRVGKSKIRPIYDTLNFVQLIMKMALYFAPLRIFFPLSLSLLLIALLWGLFSTFGLGQFADASTLIFALSGIQLGAIGMLAELIRWRIPLPSNPESR